MRPSAKEIIDGISWVLDNKIAPRSDDKWTGSHLRSVKGLLNHLSVRVEEEGGILWDDIADQRRVLSEANGVIAGADSAPWPDLRDAVADALGATWFEEGAYRSIAQMAAENLAYRELITKLIEAVHEARDSLGEARGTELHGMLTAYLRRLMAREEPLYRKPFSGKPF